jgi:hypothetical protein
MNLQISFAACSSRWLPCISVDYADKSILSGRKQIMTVYFVTDKILTITFEAGQFCCTIKSQSTYAVSRFDRFCIIVWPPSSDLNYDSAVKILHKNI